MHIHTYICLHAPHTHINAWGCLHVYMYNYKYLGYEKNPIRDNLPLLIQKHAESS